MLNDPTVYSALANLEHIAKFLNQMRYPYPDLCAVCKHRDESTKMYCSRCMPIQNQPGMENARASEFEYRN